MKKHIDKYPRTFHLSFSPELHADDKTIDVEYEDEILSSELVITVKLDGGNCCLNPLRGVFARTHAQPTDHATFDYIKNRHYHQRRHLLNQEYLYFGENMYGIHSIEYPGLEDFFYLFKILDTKTNEWLSYDEMIEEAERCGFYTAPLAARGSLPPSDVRKLIEVMQYGEWLGMKPEGFVVSKACRIAAKDFFKSVAKYVRKGHVQTDEHWEKNWKAAKLKENL